MADFERRMQRLRRYNAFHRVPRVIKDRTNPLETLSEGEVYERYRFMPASIVLLVNLLINGIDCPTNRSMPLPPMLCVLVTLQFFASIHIYIMRTIC